MIEGAASDLNVADLRIALPVARDFGVYVEGFVSSLEKTGVQVEMGWDLIHAPSNRFDFLIVQWPEWVAYVVKINTKEVLTFLNQWREVGVRLGVVVHNSVPHKHYEPAAELYSSLDGVFDFAIHLEEPSVKSFPKWAASHHVLPHPLVPFEEWSLVESVKENRRDVLVLGQLRRREERKLLFVTWRGEENCRDVVVVTPRKLPSAVTKSIYVPVSTKMAPWVRFSSTCTKRVQPSEA